MQANARLALGLMAMAVAAAAAPMAETVLAETFADAAKTDARMQWRREAWRCADGCLRPVAGTKGMSTFDAVDLDLANWRLSFRVKRFVVPEGEQHFGVICRYDDGSSLRIYCRGQAIVYWDQYGGKTREHRRLGTDFGKPLPAGEDASWSELAVVTDGPYVQVDVDGRAVGTLRREPARLRSAQFYAYNVDCAFDDLVFARLPAERERGEGAGAPDLACRADFDGTAALESGNATSEARTATGLTFVDGVRGQAVRVQDAEGTRPLLDYAAGDAFSGAGGTVMFWFRPEWDGTIDDPKRFPWYGLFAASGKDGKIPLRIWQWNWLRADLARGGEAKGFSLANRCRGSWLKGDWHHVALVWNRDGWCVLYADGIPYERGLTGDNYLPRRQEADFGAVESFSIGSQPGNPGSMRTADGSFDELRIYRTPLSADEVMAEYHRSCPVDLLVERRFVPARRPTELKVVLRPGGRLVVPAVGREVSAPVEVETWVQVLPWDGGEALAEQGFAGQVKDQVQIAVRLPALAEGDYRLACTVRRGEATVRRTFRVTAYALRAPGRAGTEGLAPGEPTCVVRCAEAEALASGPTALAALDGVRYREAGPGKADRFAFEMTFAEEQLHGPPVLLEIAWPDDKPRSMGLYMYPESESKQHRDRLEGGVQGGNEYPVSGRMQTARYLFYPDRPRYLFEARTMAPGMPAAVATVTARPLQAPLPRLAIDWPRNVPHRMLGHLDEDQSFELLYRSSPEPAKAVRHLETLCDYLDYTGQELLAYPLLRYHGIYYPVCGSYPDGALRPEGWIDLFLQVLGARGKRLVGTVNLYTLPELDLLPDRIESLIEAGMFTRDARGELVSGWRGYLPNPMHPEVNEAFLKHVGEVLRRYGRDRAFAGLDLWPNPPWNFRSLDHGYDDATVARFQAETGVAVPGGSDRDRFRVRHEFLTGPALDSWLSWRAARTTATVAEISRMAESARPGLPVFIPIGVGPDKDDALAADPAERCYREQGLDLAALRKLPGVVLTARRNPTAYRHQKHWDNAETRHDEALFDRTRAALFAVPGQATSASYLAYFESFNDSLKPEVYRSYFQNADVKAHGRFFLREFAFCLAAMDTTRMLIGAQPLGTAGRDEETREFARAYCALPAVPFAEIPGSGDPVAVRWGETRDGVYLYAVNTLCFPVATVCRLPQDAAGIELGTGGAVRTAAGCLAIELAPFQLRSFRFRAGTPPPSAAETRVPAAATDWFAARVAEVEAGVRAVAETGTDTAALAEHLAAVRDACTKGAYAEAHRLLFAKRVMELARLREAAEQGYLKQQAEMIARSAYAVNCGQGGGAFYRAANGTLFFPDQPFVPGGYGHAGGYKSVMRSVDGLVGTDDPVLFATEAYDFGSYRFAVKPGTYTVRLHLKVGYEPGAKPDVFVVDVDIEGKRKLTAADLFVLAGSDFKRAMVREFPGVEVTDGVLDIDFGAVPGHSSTARLCNAIEVVPMGK